MCDPNYDFFFVRMFSLNFSENLPTSNVQGGYSSSAIELYTLSGFKKLASLFFITPLVFTDLISL